MATPKKAKKPREAIEKAKEASPQKPVNLALQGGGSHGAFGWGVLDYLLEDGRLEFEGISATSAGAMNAVVMAQGMMEGGPQGARKALADFWRTVSNTGAWANPFKALPHLPWVSEHGDTSMEFSPFYQMADGLTRMFSPYQLNPFNINPLREILERSVDFKALRKHSPFKLYLCATNVETNKPRIFITDELCPDRVLASACLPFMFQTVEIDGEYFWDGGYIGNPPIYPLIYMTNSVDVIIVHINPIVRKGIPTTANEILNRINEISFNASLMHEMRAISFVSNLIQKKIISPNDMKDMVIHSIRSDEEMNQHTAASKLNTDWTFLKHLRDRGRAVARDWMQHHFHDVGVKSTVDIKTEYL